LTTETVAPTVSSVGMGLGYQFLARVAYLYANVDDATAMDHVDFYQDGVFLARGQGNWFQPGQIHLVGTAGAMYWTTNVVPGESHLFEARAFDIFGNQASVTQQLTVPTP